MRLLGKIEIEERLLAKGDARLSIEPLLESSQIGEVSVDLRLGPDFLVSIVTRRPSIEIARDEGRARGIGSYFRVSRRELGDRFILYPNQVVLATTLEYVALPHDLYLDLITRSSYNRLGILLNTMTQPGFRGCLSLELLNHGNNPVELVVGSRVVQARLFEMQGTHEYHSGDAPRKYYGSVRPVVSRASNDDDLGTLSRVRGSGEE